MGTKAYDNFADLITFSRASGGTALRHVGYGEELVTNGTFDTDTSGWTAEGATLSVESGRLRIDSTSTFGDCYQEITVTPGSLIQYSVDMNLTPSGTSTANLNIGSTLRGSHYRNISVNNQVVSGMFVATSSSVFIALRTVSGAGTHTFFDNVSVKEVIFDRASDPLVLFNHPANIPRVEYAADGARKGLLIEEARTNLITYSEQFDNAAWVKLNTTVAANATTAPDGTMTAEEVFDDSTSSFHRVGRSDNVTTIGVTYTASVYFKKSTLTQACLYSYGWGKGVGVDLDTGEQITVTSISNASPADVSIIDAGNGWWRVSLTGTATSSGNLAVFTLSGSAFSYAGAGGSIYIYGAQFEAGAFPTSYIPTLSGSTVTRSADVASMPVSAFGYNQKAGTVVVDYAPITPYNVPYLFQLDDGTSVNRLYWQMTGAAPSDLTIGSIGASTPLLLIATDAFSDGSFVKSATAFALNNGSVSVTGSAAVVDTTYSGLPVLVTQARIGHFGPSGSSQANGHIKSIAYYPRRLSNAQLQELTA